MLARKLQDAQSTDEVVDYLRSMPLVELGVYLYQGGDPNVVLGPSKVPLISAITKARRLDLLQRLLKEKAINPNLLDAYGYTPLSYAWGKEDIALKNLLKEHGAVGYSAHPVSLIRALKYKSNPEVGLCYGMASVGIDYMMRGRKGIQEMDALLLALGDEDTDEVVRKIEAMELYRKAYVKKYKKIIKQEVQADIKKEGRPSSKKDMDAAVQKKLDQEIRAGLKKKYGEKEAVLLDAPNYLQAIAISHTPVEFKDYFEENIFNDGRKRGQNAFITFPVVSSPEAEKQGFETPSGGMFCFDEPDEISLEAFFRSLKEQFTKDPCIKHPVAFLLERSQHGISFTFLPEENVWAFNGYAHTKTIFIDEKTLAQLIVKHLPARNDSQLSGRVYSSKVDAGKVENSLRVISQTFSDKKTSFSHKETVRKKVVKAAARDLLISGVFLSALAIGGVVVSLFVGLPLLYFLPFAIVGYMVTAAIGYADIRDVESPDVLEPQNEIYHANVRRDAGYPDPAENFLERSWKWIKEHKKMIAISVAIGVVLAASTVLTCGLFGIIGSGAIATVSLSGMSTVFSAIGTAVGSLMGFGTLGMTAASIVGFGMTAIGGALFPVLTYGIGGAIAEGMTSLASYIRERRIKSQMESTISAKAKKEGSHENSNKNINKRLHAEGAGKDNSVSVSVSEELTVTRERVPSLSSSVSFYHPSRDCGEEAPQVLQDTTKSAEHDNAPSRSRFG